ncbi:hypothetical protein OUZ56_016323 [Daphnia magna]|uniref:Uncharacterized protein n=2 Tax=Daphnia magna TaxID=35525 RepID=A0ABR0AQR4_9CRUS|nr:hypothetical protein OUZ56_016323 [Daphnia magna]
MPRYELIVYVQFEAIKTGPIKCRVTHKVTFLTHSNTCLIINLIDGNGDEIRLQPPYGARRKLQNMWINLKILNKRTLVSTQSTKVSLVNAKENEEFPDLAYNYMSVSSIGDIADREIIDVIGIFYKKKKKVIPLQSYTKEEHSIKILDDKGKKMEVGCLTIEQFLQKMKIEELKTIIGLKGVRLVRKGEKLECVTYSVTIIDIDPASKHTEELKKWMAAESSEGETAEATK